MDYANKGAIIESNKVPQGSFVVGGPGVERYSASVWRKTLSRTPLDRRSVEVTRRPVVSVPEVAKLWMRGSSFSRVCTTARLRCNGQEWFKKILLTGFRANKFFCLSKMLPSAPSACTSIYLTRS